MRRFSEEYPESYAYFRSAIEGELGVPDTGDEDRAALTSALIQIDQVRVIRKCACREPGCETFGFANTEVGYGRSLLLDSARATIVVDFDAQGNLLGLEKAP